jgi:hypothetical protein
MTATLRRGFESQAGRLGQNRPVDKLDAAAIEAQLRFWRTQFEAERRFVGGVIEFAQHRYL